ncbi:MAG: Ig-like domain-containing protein [Pantoea dispersa]|nr:Ig-like domain-containing protein [Pantoea dispersa]
MNQGDTTDDAQPEISGTAEAGSIVTVYDGDIALGSVQADASGSWRFIPVPPLVNGPHDISAKAQDAAGNVSAPSNSIGFDLLAGGVATAPAITNVLDDVAPVTGNVGPSGYTNDKQPTLVGTAQPGHLVTIEVDGVAVGSFTVDASGRWEFTLPNELADGMHDFVANAKDAAGNEMPPSGAYVIIVDTVAPLPGTAVLTDDVGDVTGPIVQGSVTDDSTPTYTGKAEASTTIIVYDGDKELGTAKADSQGNWSFTPNKPLEDGKHQFSFEVVDRAGNVSVPSDVIDFTVDTSGILVSIDYAKDDEGLKTDNLTTGATTDDTTPILVGKAIANAIVTITVVATGAVIGSAKANAFGEWSLELPPQALGSHTWKASVINAAGVVASSNEFTLEIDNSKPENKGIETAFDNVGADTGYLNDGDTTDDSTPTFNGQGQTPGDVIFISDNGLVLGSAIVDEAGSWTFTPDTPLLDGNHEFTTVVENPQGVVSDVSDPFNLIIETRAPSKPTITDVYDDVGTSTGPVTPGSTTDDAQPEIRGTGTAGSRIVIYDNGVQIGTAVVDASGNWAFTPARPMANALHTITAREMSGAGNLSEPSNEWKFTVDANSLPVAPTIDLVMDDVGVIIGKVNPDGVTDDARPTISGTANPGNIVTVYANGVAIGTAVAAADGSWSLTPSTDLVDGGVEFTARATNPAGNVSGDSNLYAIEIDTDKPNAITGDTLIDDVGADQGEIHDKDTTDDSTPTWSGKAEPGATIIISDNGKEIGRVPVDSNGDWTFTPVPPLADGDHSFSAVVQDPAGNQSAPSAPINFTVDTSNVLVTINYMTDDVGIYQGNFPSNTVTDDTTPTLVGKATASSLVYIYQDNGTTPVGSVMSNSLGDWSWTSPTLVDNTYVFTATVVDPATGSESAKTGEFKVIIDLTAPTKPVIEDVIDDVGSKRGRLDHDDVTDDARPTLIGKGVAGDLVTVHDLSTGRTLGSVRVDTSGNWSFIPTTDLADGLHRFVVDITDPAGNKSAQSDEYPINIDTQAPEVAEIVKAVDNFGNKQGDVLSNGRTDDKTPEIIGKAEANSLVTIEINDGSGWKVVSTTQADSNGNWSWEPTQELEYGKYSIRAISEDAAGNSSNYSSNFSLEIAPDIGIEEFAAKQASLIGGYTFASGLTLSVAAMGYYPSNSLAASPGVSYSSGSSLGYASSMLVSSNAQIRLGIPDGGAEEVSLLFKNGYASAATVVIYSTTGAVLSRTSVAGQEKFISYSSKSGEKVGSVVIIGSNQKPFILWQGDIVRHPVSTLDYLVWGAKGSGADKGRPAASSMSVQSDDENMYQYMDDNGQIHNEHFTPEQVAQIEHGDKPDYKSVNSADQTPVSQQDAPVVQDNSVVQVNHASAEPNIPEAGVSTEGHQDVLEGAMRELVLDNSLQVIDLKLILSEGMDVHAINMENDEHNVLNVALADVMVYGKTSAFIPDDSKQLLIKGDKNDVVNLSDLLPDGTDTGDWAKADGTVTVGGVQYEVYQHSGADTELLVQLGVQTNLNNH